MHKVPVYHKTFQEHAVETIGHYWALVTKNDQFFEHVEYKGFSGTAVHDEIKFLKSHYPASEGYKISW